MEASERDGSSRSEESRNVNSRGQARAGWPRSQGEDVSSGDRIAEGAADKSGAQGRLPDSPCQREAGSLRTEAAAMFLLSCLKNADLEGT